MQQCISAHAILIAHGLSYQQAQQAAVSLSLEVHQLLGNSNYSYLNTMRKKRNLELNFILSEEDKFSWQFSNKGYFNFKNNIPKILTSFNLQ